MTDFYAALVGAGGVVIGAIVSAVSTLRMARIGFNERRLRAKVLRLMRDLEFMGHLEGELLNRLHANQQGSEHVTKSATREVVRVKLNRALSQHAELARLRKQIQAAEDALG